jgi:predicted small secreted protein
MITQNNHKYICKLTGERNHDFMEIIDDKILKIKKSKIENSQMIQTNWIFEMDKIYEENITFSEVYENEIVCADFFSEVFKDGMKCSFIFVAGNNDSFTEGGLFTFVINSVSDILTELTKTGEEYFLTVSYLDINKSILNDNYNFSKANEKSIKNSLKIVEFNQDVNIEQMREIQISDKTNVEYLMKYDNLLNI